MPNMSVKEAATKFGLSERRVQKLCESDRIVGAERISGVWVIPCNAEKPLDDRISDVAEMDNVLSLTEVCSQLRVSLATGRNWIKLGKLVPSGMKGRSPYFTRDYVDSLKEDIKSGENQTLKSRRNKKFVFGKSIYGSYVSDACMGIRSVESVLDIVSLNSIDIDDELLGLILANAAIQMISERLHKNTIFLIDYLETPNRIGEYAKLVSDLIKDISSARNKFEEYENLFRVDFKWENNEDILGLLYLSCLNIRNRKATGSYYTPTTLVKKLISKLGIEKAIHPQRILDPCCGTGNFLLQLPETVDVENIYGNDIDKLSIIIARINIALKFRLKELQVVTRNITNSDYLIDYDNSGFDYVIGNPPWGYEYSDEESFYLDFKYTTARGTKTESYDVFTEHALETVGKNGTVSFILPEAILNVKSHLGIRNLIAECTSVSYLEYLGNAFNGVQCPCIILQLSVTGEKMSTVGTIVSTKDQSYQIQQERVINPECFSFAMNDDEYTILEKIEHISPVVYLKGQASFALGIVTGNNEEFISRVKTSENEMVLRGSDLLKYRFVPAQNFIVFKPDEFQQVAQTEYYRSQEKLLYRFICNQLVFAYDNTQTLSLNSCNILIPKIPGLSIKYIMAILNSRIIQYYFKKKFNSVKVLRSHIEHIPIAYPTKKVHDEVVSTVNLLLNSKEAEIIVDLFNQLDKNFSAIYGMSETEYQSIRESVDSENLFLV